MSLLPTSRPRVAAIGLNEDQAVSIGPLCGTLRTADSVGEYVKEFSWTETDIVIGTGLEGEVVGNEVHVVAIEPRSWTYYQGTQIVPGWGGGGGPARRVGVTLSIDTDGTNTERELSVPETYSGYYKDLARDLKQRLRRSGQAPATLSLFGRAKSKEHLVETTSGHPVAVRCTRLYQSREGKAQGGSQRPYFVVLALPQVDNLSEWFRAFLSDVHQIDTTRVPYAPPRLLKPDDWYTPEENALAQQLTDVRSQITRLEAEVEQLKADLKSATKTADAGIRRVLWAVGDDLEAGVGELLTHCGFKVEYMDTQSERRDALREDLRLTVDDRPGWEAIAEVKGYVRGAQGGDTRQIREQRDNYATEKKGKFSDSTLWIANPYRLQDPSNRPAPARQAKEAAERIGATYVAVPDLYRLWLRVARRTLIAFYSQTTTDRRRFLFPSMSRRNYARDYDAPSARACPFRQEWAF